MVVVGGGAGLAGGSRRTAPPALALDEVQAQPFIDWLREAESEEEEESGSSEASGGTGGGRQGGEATRGPSRPWWGRRLPALGVGGVCDPSKPPQDWGRLVP